MNQVHLNWAREGSPSQIPEKMTHPFPTLYHVTVYNLATLPAGRIVVLGLPPRGHPGAPGEAVVVREGEPRHVGEDVGHVMVEVLFGQL